MLLFLLPLFALALIMLPFFVMLKRRKEGKPLKTRKAILINEKNKKNKKNLICRQVSTKNIDTICYNLYIGGMRYGCYFSNKKT